MIALFELSYVQAVKICGPVYVDGVPTMRCSSQTSCYSNKQFDSSPCLEGEVCAFWSSGNYGYEGCLMESYCGVTGRYEYFKGYFDETLFTCPPEPECSIVPTSKYFNTCPENRHCAYNGYESTCVEAAVCGTDYVSHSKVLGQYLCNPDPKTNEVIVLPDEDEPEEPEPDAPIPTIAGAFDVIAPTEIPEEDMEEELISAITMQSKIHCAFFLMVF